MSVNVCVVGYGRSGEKFHAYLVSLVEGLNVAAVATRNDERRALAVAQHGCRGYASLEEALADDGLDLFVLATPNHLHAAQAELALAAGKHVVTDKPACLALADWDRLSALAAARGRLLSVFQNRRHDGDWLTLRSLLDAGELGELHWSEMAWQGPRPWGGWRGRREFGGGKYWDLGAHLVDQTCLLFPHPVESVYCRMHHDYDTTDTESEALLVISFGDGRTGVCDFSSMAFRSKPRFYVRGLEGTFEKYGLDPQEAAMMAGDIDTAVEHPETYGTLYTAAGARVTPTLPGRWRNYYENIAAVLLEGAELEVKPEQVRRAIQILDAGVRSAASGQVIAGDELETG